MSFWGRKSIYISEEGGRDRRESEIPTHENNRNHDGCCVFCVCIQMIDIGSKCNKQIAARLIAKPKCKPKPSMAYLAVQEKERLKASLFVVIQIIAY